MIRFPLFLPASDSALLVKFGEGISIENHTLVLRATQSVLSGKIKAVRNLHPAYDSILISFDAITMSHLELEREIRSLFEKRSDISKAEGRAVEIPTCYGGTLGPDLGDVAEHCHLGIDDVIRMHSSANYIVYFLGFSPGFPYLGGMAGELAMPRLSTPRTKVPAGSVAIGGNQTGIYPVESPGGWRIIGRTPLRLFDPVNKRPTHLEIGDRVRFVPITQDDFQKLASR